MEFTHRTMGTECRHRNLDSRIWRVFFLWLILAAVAHGAARLSDLSYDARVEQADSIVLVPGTVGEVGFNFGAGGFRFKTTPLQIVFKGSPLPEAMSLRFPLDDRLQIRRITLNRWTEVDHTGSWILYFLKKTPAGEFEDVSTSLLLYSFDFSAPPPTTTLFELVTWILQSNDANNRQRVLWMINGTRDPQLLNFLTSMLPTASEEETRIINRILERAERATVPLPDPEEDERPYWRRLWNTWYWAWKYNDHRQRTFVYIYGALLLLCGMAWRTGLRRGV